MDQIKKKLNSKKIIILEEGGGVRTLGKLIAAGLLVGVVVRLRARDGDGLATRSVAPTARVRKLLLGYDPVNLCKVKRSKSI